MVDPSHSFHVADYVVFGVTIIVSIGIGIYYAMAGDRQRTTSEYLVGGRSMKFLPVAISLMVSFESSIMMLGLPAEMYVFGVQWWLSCVGFLVSQVISIFIIVPLLHPLKITSAYEYLQLRFNSTAVRLLGSLLGMLIYVWYMGIVLFGPAIALEAVTGFSQWSSIFLVAAVAVIYTSIGGIKAVIWTDVFQAFVMYAGMFAILIKGTMDVGGASKVWEIAREGGRLEFFNFDPDPRTRHTFWNLVFGTILRAFGLAFNQSTIQRISSTRSQREAKLVMLITAPCFFLSLTMACYEGIVAYAYYQTVGCDPLASNKISNPNQVIPFAVMDIFKNLPGLPGLFLASLFSASLSTLSSGLSSLSALMWADFLKPRIGEVSEFKATVIAKISVVVFGLLGCGVAILVSTIGGTLTQIATSLLAAFGGPLTGLFFMGCFCPWVNAKGAFTGGFVSLVFSSWLSLGSNFSKSVKQPPWLPLASTDKCAANQNASFFSTTTASGAETASYYYGGMTGAILNVSHYEYDSVYGARFDGRDVYSTAAASALESTIAEAVLETGPQGVEVMYTLSYQWLAPLGVILTMVIGSFVSVITGGNKKGDVHPRYLISFFDHFCYYLPESVRKLCRCAEDYTSVKDELPPVHDLYVDKEFIVPDPIGKEAAADEDHPATLTLITELEVMSHQEVTSPGSDVSLGHAATQDDTGTGTGSAVAGEEPQNGGASVARSSAATTGGDDDDDGDVTKANDERKVEGDEKREEKEEEEEEHEEEEEKEEEEEEGADSAEARLLQAGTTTGRT